MRLKDGLYVCAVCDARLEVADLSRVQIMLIRASGQPNLRAILVDGVEIHRCEVPRQEQGESRS
jgi:hypothetical protein